MSEHPLRRRRPSVLMREAVCSPACTKMSYDEAVYPKVVAQLFRSNPQSDKIYQEILKASSAPVASFY